VTYAASCGAAATRRACWPCDASGLGGDAFISPTSTANGVVKSGYTLQLDPGTGAIAVLAAAARATTRHRSPPITRRRRRRRLGQTGTARRTNNSGTIYQNFNGIVIPATMAGAQILQ